MKNAKQETIADIVAQLRAAAHIQTADSPRDVLKFADRIEAAASTTRRASRNGRTRAMKARCSSEEGGGEMSNENHEAIKETIEDIVRDMRIGDIRATANTSSAVERRAFKYINDFLAGYADRIEAAAKREREAGAETAQICGEIGEMIGREATREKSSQVCNAAKMHEALVKADAAFSRIVKSAWFIEANFHETKEVMDAGNAIEAALAAPTRNCDVGTADEQEARHSKWCCHYGIDGTKDVPCAHPDMECSLCVLRWSQMPYEHEDTK